jgi:hypothetical protein
MSKYKGAFKLPDLSDEKAIGVNLIELSPEKTIGLANCKLTDSSPLVIGLFANLCISSKYGN